MSLEIKKYNESSEEIASHTIRANHELLLGLTAAKEASEKMTNEFPDLLGVILENGKIIRGNGSFCEVLGCEIEDVIDFAIKKLFKKKTWNLIKRQFKREDPITTFTLELPIDGSDAERIFLWTFNRFTAVSDRRGNLWSFLAKDITKQKQTEGKLSAIFSAIPLGVMTINREGKIDWPYSAYSEVLLDRDDLTDLDANEALFGKSKRFMTTEDIEHIGNLMGLLGEDEDWYEMVHKQLPTEMPFASSLEALEADKWRSLHYSPVVQNGIIEKVLVIVEDITERVRQRNEMSQQLTKEQKIAQLIFDLQDIDQSLLEPCMEDIDSYMSNAEKAAKDGVDSRGFCDLLHGIKGVARTVNLNVYKSFVHEMESRIMRNAPTIDKDSAKYLSLEYSALDEEWKEIKKYQSIIYGRNETGESKVKVNDGISWGDLKERQARLLEQYSGIIGDSSEFGDQFVKIKNSIQELSHVELNLLTEKFHHLSEITAKRLGKNIELVIDWHDNKVDKPYLSILTEIITHLLTNAIDHGVELPEERVASGKDAIGRISMEGTLEGDQFKFKLVDDGAGINPEKVLASAIKKGLVKDGTDMSKEDIFKLLLASGFSTVEEASDISGHGIGLGAVDKRIKDNGGPKGLEISSELGKGTEMNFELCLTS